MHTGHLPKRAGRRSRSRHRSRRARHSIVTAIEIAFLAGRIVVAMFYLSSAFSHFKDVNTMAPVAAAKGVPAPAMAIAGSGVLLLIGGLSILLGIYPFVGVTAILLFLLPVSVVMHNYWAIEDSTQKMNDRINFWKNLALAGSTLMFLAIPEPWPFSVHFLR